MAVMVIEKLLRYGIRGTCRRLSRIMLNILRSASFEIRHGARLRDKLALVAIWMVALPQMLVRGKFSVMKLSPKSYFFDVLMKTSDGLLYYAKSGTYDALNLVFDELPEGAGHRLDKSLFEISEGIFIDVGANTGKYTLMMSKRLGTKGLVVAIEPNPDVYHRLLRNIDINKLTNVIPLPIAVGSNNQRAIFFIHPRYQGGSLLSPYSLSDSTHYPSGVEIEVEVRRLDDVIKELKLNDRVRLVKIDVEGCEYEVLCGMREILSKHQPRVIFEAWDETYLKPIERLLKEHGYRVERVSEYNYIGLPVS